MPNPIIITYYDKSSTVVTVSAYTDSAITLPEITTSNPQPILASCRAILKLTSGVAKPYPVHVYRGATFLYEIKSVYWGSMQTMSDEQSDDDYYFNRNKF